MTDVFHRRSGAKREAKTVPPGWMRRLEYYGLALLFVAAAAALRWALPEVLGPTPFLAFYLAWVGAAAFGGLGPGLLATAASWLCIELLFHFTPGQTIFSSPADLGRFMVLMAGGLTVSLVAETMRRGRIRERDSEAQLRTVVENLTEGLVAADLSGRVFQWNRTALAMHGFASLAEAQRRLPEFADLFQLSTLDGKALPLEQWPLARVLRGEDLRDWEVRVRRIAGRLGADLQLRRLPRAGRAGPTAVGGAHHHRHHRAQAGGRGVAPERIVLPANAGIHSRHGLHDSPGRLLRLPEPAVGGLHGGPDVRASRRRLEQAAASGRPAPRVRRLAGRGGGQGPLRPGIPRSSRGRPVRVVQGDWPAHSRRDRTDRALVRRGDQHRSDQAGGRSPAPSQRAASGAGGGTGRHQQGSGAVRLCGFARPAGALAGRGGIPDAPAAALSGPARREGRQLYQRRRRWGYADAGAHQWPAGVLPRGHARQRAGPGPGR